MQIHHQFSSFARPSAFIAVLLLAFATSVDAQPAATALPDISYEFRQESGTNAAVVLFDPVRKLYYTVIAGNSEFPLESFNERGEAKGQYMAGMDTRGLWYNPKTAALEGNAYGDAGTFLHIMTGDGGVSGDVKMIYEGVSPPDDQCVGAYDNKLKKIVYFFEGSLFFASPKNGKMKNPFALQLSVGAGDYNFTTVAYTGKENFEFALLNLYGKVEFYNRKGKLTASTQLPETAPLPDSFRFSFANDRVWLYSIDNRTWNSYKVF